MESIQSGEEKMAPEAVKATGYLISTLSVLLLGVAAWPGAARAGLLPALILGMATSIIGMALRLFSYELEKRQPRGTHSTGPQS